MENYVVKKRLGKGAQGVVVLALDKDGKKVAIKQICCDNEDQVGKVKAEVSLVMKLDHPNIIKYKEVFTVVSEDQFTQLKSYQVYIVMDYCSTSLEKVLNQRIKKKQPLKVNVIQSWARQIFMSLIYLHEQKIIHRDIKPDNILLVATDDPTGADWNVKLIDFGNMKQLLGMNILTGTFVGTLLYMAPEVLGKAKYSYSADIFSASVVLYQLTTLKASMQLPNFPALLETNKNFVYNDLKKYDSGFARIIHQACKFKPKNRLEAPAIVTLIEKNLKALETDPNSRRKSSARSSLFAKIFQKKIKDTNIEMDKEEVRPRRSSRNGGSPSKITTHQNNGDDELLINLMKESKKGVSIKNRRYFFKTYKKSFVGKEFVSWACSSLEWIKDRKDATEYGQELLDRYVFYHVNNSETFKDSKHLYRLRDDEENIVLNKYEAFLGKKRKSQEVLQEFIKLMREIVDKYCHGIRVDYSGLSKSETFKKMKEIVKEFQVLNLSDFNEKERLCFFLNAYNILQIHGYIENGPPVNSKERSGFFLKTQYCIGGEDYSLEIIEHGILRANSIPPGSYKKKFKKKDPRAKYAMKIIDPRIHFVKSYGTKASPQLRAISPSTMEKDLNDASEEHCNNKIQVRVQNNEVCLSKLFLWYASDFGGNERSLLDWIYKHCDEKNKNIVGGMMIRTSISIKYVSYNWLPNYMDYEDQKTM